MRYRKVYYDMGVVVVNKSWFLEARKIFNYKCHLPYRSFMVEASFLQQNKLTNHLTMSFNKKRRLRQMWKSSYRNIWWNAYFNDEI